MNVRLGRAYYKMSISEKTKTIDNKIEQNKAQYDLDRQTAKISAYHQEMLVNMNFELAKMFYLKKTCYKKLLQRKSLNIHH